MTVDLNQLAERLKQQRTVSVTRDGRLIDREPKIKDNEDNHGEYTTLVPQRFYLD